MNTYIVFDWCGWDERYGRFTHMPSGDTLVQQAYYDQQQWDKAQLDWFRKYPGLKVHRCLQGAYRETNDMMGTTDTICERLNQRLVVCTQ